MSGIAAQILRNTHPDDLVASLEAGRAAVASTLRCRLEDTHHRARPRRLLIQVVDTISPRCATALAPTLQCHRRTIQRARQRARITPDTSLPTALACLADPRLRIHDVWPTSRHNGLSYRG